MSSSMVADMPLAYSSYVLQAKARALIHLCGRIERRTLILVLRWSQSANAWAVTVM
jgi:hypothetical protein